MRKLLVLLPFLLPVLPTVSRADTVTYGPVTLGTSSPFGEPGLYDLSNGESVLNAIFPGLNLQSSVGSQFLSGSVSFAYDLAPGWTADAIIYDGVDYGTTDAHVYAGDWAVAYFQELILCPASATTACTSGALVQEQVGHAPVPTGFLTPNAVAEPGTGIYEYAEYADNAGFATNGVNAGVNIFLTPVPEPSTFVLLGSGAFGLLGLTKRRWQGRRAQTSI